MNMSFKLILNEFLLIYIRYFMTHLINAMV